MKRRRRPTVASCFQSGLLEGLWISERVRYVICWQSEREVAIVTSISKILVPVDFSEHAAQALRFAADLALKYRASLTILHVNELVISLAPYAPVPSSLIDEAAAEARTLLAREKAHATSLGVSLVETALIDGRAYYEIVGFAEQGSYDLIVMGTHGRSGFNRVMLGSVAEHVVRRAGRPVLAVPLRSAAKAEPG
jgi:nucleotide-binding universal stress UspA family protein